MGSCTASFKSEPPNVGIVGSSTGGAVVISSSGGEEGSIEFSSSSGELSARRGIDEVSVVISGVS